MFMNLVLYTILNIPNENVLKTVARKPLVNSVRKRQLGWLGHVLLRPESEEPAKIFALYTPENGKQWRGRPTQSYQQQIATFLTGSSRDVTPDQIVALANNKAEWNKRTADQGR